MNGTVAGANPSYPMSSLYVGDLHPDITEAMLYEKFSQSGPVLSIRVCRDLVTRRSLGYAYVNFQQPGDAERALDTMNFDEIKGAPMRIMWSQRDPSVRKSGVGNIFIKNLDKTIDNKQLYDTFSQFGNILSCKIVKDDKAVSKGYGFVHFELDESAFAAIDQVNGMLLNDRKVFVGRFKNKGDRMRDMGDRSKQFTNVFVKNLPEDFTEEDLKTLVTGFGECLSVKLMSDDYGKSKCFGFCSYNDHEEADKAVLAINDKEVRGKIIWAGRAQKKAERLQELKAAYEKRKADRQQKYAGVNLYVKNLDDTVTDDMLREAFETHGTITSAKVMNENGTSKGFGFVCFSSPEEATKAVTEMNGRIVGSKPLYVALAQRKEDRKAHLQAQYMQRAGNPANTIRPGMAQTPMTPGFNGYPMSIQPNYYQMPPLAQNRFLGPGAMGVPRYGAPGGPRPGFNLNQVRPGQIQPRVNPNLRPNVAAQQMYQLGNMGRIPNQMIGLGQLGGQQIIRPNANFPNQPQMGAPFKYTPGARNTTQTMIDQNIGQNMNAVAQPQPQQPPQPGQSGDRGNELTAAMLASAQPSEQKQMLGERIYPLVSDQVGQDQAGKVTGMLLEIDNSELLLMLENKELLKDKVQEAVTVLASHNEQKPEA